MILDFRFWILDWGVGELSQGIAGVLKFLSGNSKSKIQKRPRRPRCAAVLVALLLGGNAQAAEQPKWQTEWQRVVEGAKKEGQLSLYGGQEITHPDIIAAFNKEFPFVKVTSASGRAADMLTRIVAERRADKYLADITASGPNGPRTLYLNKILDPIAPAFILPEVTDTTKWYGGKHWYADPENKYIFMFE